MKRLIMFLILIVLAAFISFGVISCADDSPSPLHFPPNEPPSEQPNGDTPDEITPDDTDTDTDTDINPDADADADTDTDINPDTDTDTDEDDTDEPILPAAPTNLSALAGDGEVVLSWNEVTEATSYNLYWSTTAGVTRENGTKIADVSSPYTHPGLTNDITYYYIVTAVNTDSESEESAEVLAMPVAAVEPPEFWIKVLEDQKSNPFNTIRLTDDGDYICAGSRKFLPWLVKITEQGDLSWQKEYQRSTNDASIAPTGEEFTLIEKIPSGYILARNYIVLENNAKAIWIIELDSACNIVWEKAYADPNGKDVKLTSMNILVTANSCIIPLRIESAWQWQVGMLEINITNGEIIGEVKTYQASSGDYLQYIQEVSVGGDIAVGWTWTGSDYDLWIVRRNSQGNVLWAKRYGEAGMDFGFSIKEIDNGFLVNAATTSFGTGECDAWILCLNDEGDILWQKTYGGSADDYLYIMEKMIDEYILAGATQSFGAGDRDGWIVVLDNQGEISWQKTYGGNDNDELLDIRLSDNALLAVGYVNGYADMFDVEFFDAWLLKLDSHGYTDDSCDLINNSNAIVTTTNVVPVDTAVTIETTEINSVTADNPIVKNTETALQIVCP